MAVRWLPSHFLTRRALIVGLLVGLAAVVAAPYGWAWYQLGAAEADLEAYRPDAAREHLGQCLRFWPNSEQAHLLASRAARQQADFPEAERHLRACQRQHGGSSEEIALEWALLQAASGNLAEVEEYLQRQTERHPQRAPVIWEAVAEGYIRVYRSLDALACLDLWLRLDPDNLRALELRGEAYQKGKSAGRGAESFRRVLELDPSRAGTRRRLTQCLLQMGSYDEALPHLEELARDHPDDPELQVGLARCHAMLGRPDHARQLLDGLLERHPEDVAALRTRGQFALSDGQMGPAERWLRRATDIEPNDYNTQWLLFRALQGQNKDEEAKAQLRKTEAIKQRAERLSELTSRELALQPLDPALHYEMGMLLLRNGDENTAEGWLLSALRLNPKYDPAHRALAEVYQKRGETDRAEEHHRQAAEQP